MEKIKELQIITNYSSNYIGKWMKYPWISGYSTDVLMHPEEFTKRQGQFSIGLAHCIAIENEYMVLKTKNDVFRIKYSEDVTLLPDPPFIWEEEVCEVERPEVRGIVDDIEWHRVDSEYKYYLIVNGKRKSRRYNQAELQRIPQ